MAACSGASQSVSLLAERLSLQMADAPADAAERLPHVPLPSRFVQPRTQVCPAWRQPHTDGHISGVRESLEVRFEPFGPHEQRTRMGPRIVRIRLCGDEREPFDGRVRLTCTQAARRHEQPHVDGEISGVRASLEVRFAPFEPREQRARSRSNRVKIRHVTTNASLLTVTSCLPCAPALTARPH